MDRLSAVQILIASTISKIVASSATYPHEIIRTRLQVQRHKNPKYEGILHAIGTILKEEGISGMYRGLRTNIIRVIPASAVTFLTYEYLLRHLSSIN